MRLAVLASHEGTTLQSLIDLCRAEEADATIAVVISNNSDSGALRRAREAGIPTVHLSSRTHPEEDVLDRAIVQTLIQQAVDLVVLAGYMKKVGPAILKAFEGRIISTHPGPLPQFGGKGMFGMSVHRAVVTAGVKESAATVFGITEDYDDGPVIAQRPVQVLAGDTAESLSERVKEAERKLLVEVVGQIAAGNVEAVDGLNVQG